MNFLVNVIAIHLAISQVMNKDCWTSIPHSLSTEDLMDLREESTAQPCDKWTSAHAHINCLDDQCNCIQQSKKKKKAFAHYLMQLKNGSLTNNLSGPK